MRKWMYLTLLALSAAAPAKQATVTKNVTTNSTKALNADRCHGTSKPTFSCDAISAQASIQQAQDADWQAYAAVAGGVTGVLTLLAAVAAAVYAGRAARDTKRTADIAEANAQDTVKALEIARRNADSADNHVAVARETAEIQLRAYLTIIDVTYDPKTNIDPCFTVVIKNFGQTPAKITALKFSGMVLDGADKLSFGEYDNEASSYIASTFEVRVPYNIDTDVFSVAEAYGDSGSVMCFGYVKYDDIYGKPRQSSFTFVSPDKFDPRKKVRFGAADKGQWAT